jgi:hypothetical protein
MSESYRLRAARSASCCRHTQIKPVHKASIGVHAASRCRRRTTRRRRSEKADVENLHRIPSARTIARHDGGAGYALEGGDDHCRRRRGWRSHPCRSSRDRSRIPRDDPAQSRRRVVILNRARSRQAYRFICPRRNERLSDGSRGNRIALVQRTVRGAGHPPQARQTANVRPRQARFASGSADRRSMK